MNILNLIGRWRLFRESSRNNASFEDRIVLPKGYKIPVVEFRHSETTHYKSGGWCLVKVDGDDIESILYLRDIKETVLTQIINTRIEEGTTYLSFAGGQTLHEPSLLTPNDPAMVGKIESMWTKAVDKNKKLNTN